LKIIDPVAYKQRDFCYTQLVEVLNKQNSIVRTVLIFVLCKKQILLVSLIPGMED